MEGNLAEYDTRGWEEPLWEGTAILDITEEQ